MPTITGIFCRRRRLDSLFLRTAMWSSWSHVAVVLPEPNTIIDATFSHGVSERLLDRLVASSSQYQVRHFEAPDPEAGYAFARSCLGLPYDTKGVIGIGLHRDWQKPDAFFCSEFLEAVLAAAGNKRFINQIHRVTTQHSWMVR